MKIKLLAFASASEAIGRSELEIEVDEGLDVAALKALLDERYPALSGLWARLAVAIEGEVAEDAALLADGVEVALLPPVSGGSRDPRGSQGPCETLLTASSIDVSRAVDRVQQPGCGAIVLFVGTVRNRHQGRLVLGITYSAYETMARRRLDLIAKELRAKSPSLSLCIEHRLGRLDVGEASVVIAVASPHREQAFDASRTALERLKAEVPIWKREHYDDGSEVWREEESLLRPPR